MHVNHYSIDKSVSPHKIEVSEVGNSQQDLTNRA